MNEKPVLVIDDDEELGALLTDYLTREGYRVRVAGNGREGLALARSEAHCLALLDIMLPDMDGFEVIRQLRKHSTLPVIMLTARGEEVDRIVGLELGADDYLPKPFNPRELAARMKAVLRRSEEARGDAAEPAPGQETATLPGPPATPGQASAGGLTLHLEGYRAQLDGHDLALTAIEFALLRELMLAPGRVLTRETLLDRVRGRDFEAFDRSIDVHISNMRHKLGDDPKAPRFIRTVRSVGYVFIGADN